MNVRIVNAHGLFKLLIGFQQVRGQIVRAVLRILQPKEVVNGGLQIVDRRLVGPVGNVQSAIGENLQKIERLYVPQKTKKTEHIEGSPAEIAKKLVDKLRNELRVL